MAERLAGASVDNRNKHAPAVAPVVDEGEVGGPALVGILGDGAGDFDAWAVSGPAFGKCPALELHGAVNFLDVDEVPCSRRRRLRRAWAGPHSRWALVNRTVGSPFLLPVQLSRWMLQDGP